MCPTEPVAPIFTTARLLCRRWRASDIEPLVAVYGDAEAMRWVGDGKAISRSDCERWQQITESNYLKRGYGMFALEDRATGQVVGFCGLIHPGGQIEPEVKYAFLRSHWGLGLATEAIGALLEHAATAFGLNEVIATVAPAHIASQNVLVKVGMAPAGSRTAQDGAVVLVYRWRSSPDAEILSFGSRQDGAPAASL